MPVPMTLPQGHQYGAYEGAVRDALVEHVLAAWSPKKTYHDPQEEEDGPGALPRATIMLVDVVPDEEESAMSVEAVRLEYEIRLRAAKPTAGSGLSRELSLHSERLGRLDALRRRLTKDRRLKTRLGSFNYEWLGDQLLPRDGEAVEREVRNPWFEVALAFAVVVRVPLYQDGARAQVYSTDASLTPTGLGGGYQRLPGITETS